MDQLEKEQKLINIASENFEWYQKSGIIVTKTWLEENLWKENFKIILLREKKLKRILKSK